jgi:hypothetical protein
VDIAQISLKSLISKVNNENILEVWRVNYLTHSSNSKPQFVILLLDHGHVCTCLLILNRGLVCRHFFQVMIRSTKAQFSISLIKRRWFKLENQISSLNDDELNNFETDDLSVTDPIERVFMDINGNLLSITQSSTVLDVLGEEGSMDDINMKIKTRHLYSDLFGLGRKIAQIATEK